MKLKVVLKGKDEMVFTKASDGWWEHITSTGNGYAINPSKTKCITDPWYADYMCEAPEHEIVSIKEIK